MSKCCGAMEAHKNLIYSDARALAASILASPRCVPIPKPVAPWIVLLTHFQSNKDMCKRYCLVWFRALQVVLPEIDGIANSRPITRFARMRACHRVPPLYARRLPSRSCNGTRRSIDLRNSRMNNLGQCDA